MRRMSNDDNEESVSSEEEAVDSDPEVDIRVMPKRSTRGKRMHALVGEEVEADEEFWGQAAFQENIEDDKDYRFVDQEDIVDSDIDLSEGDEPDAQDVEPEKRKRSSHAYREPSALRKLKKRMGVASSNTKGKKRQKRVFEPRGEKMSLRRSTQSRSESVAKEVIARKKRQGKKIGKKISGEAAAFARLTQEEMLMSALVTEQANKRSMKEILSAAASKNQRKPPSDKGSGPMIRFHSRKNPPRHVLTFTDVSRVPAVINSKECAYRKRSSTCVITGRPAKYRDPLTGMAFSNLDAFREIRRRYGPADEGKVVGGGMGGRDGNSE
eukprot:g5175.t1